ncbi:MULTISPECIES: helix-turn-helix domain-containing protein [unclassified Polaribacter]|uniref:helix-turn-helix domain-containing protein n=1 Tax=unclassified Polaribacter TaxID=196858 RepID=UPI0011BF9367|nr:MULTISPECIES: helix-turn-helix transcriptional regulator [unclassified Polaribacter]TXD53187.1 helix-turn-helix transcriptional regulator [Polaribacter sp. IC063]TXD61335.1 helix-turn-helix transcriptional regulator [Polaribacter sp. IC066]
MSFFGKNIKKIRTVKGLSQTAFADIFGLKRSALGAYEEHRSEPKIETIIKIANYFSIKIDTLLTSDITVNELLQFKESLATYTEDIKKEPFAKVPCITDNNNIDYLQHFKNDIFIDEMPCLQIPINTSKNFRAFTVSSLEMTNKDKGFYPKDIVIGEQTPINVIKKLTNGTLVFAIIDNNILFRRLHITNNNVIFRADHKNIEDEIYKISDVKELWRVRYVFCKRIPEFSTSFEDKLITIEQEILKMKAKME